MLTRSIEYLLTRHHHAHVYHFEVVALQHDGHNIFTDVMHIALDRGHYYLALGREIAGAQFFRFNKRYQMRYRLLHHTCRFHHLRQKHFARAKQIADHVHAGH